MKRSHTTYFNSQAELHRVFLHPGGRTASERLMGFLPETGVAERAFFIHHDLSDGKIPVESDSITSAFAESVVALLDPERIMRECLRVLKSGGIMVLNERVWGTSTTPEERQRANRDCLELLGVQAASLNPATAREWESHVKTIGFEVLSVEAISYSRELPGSRLGRAIPVLLSPGTLRTILRDRLLARRYKQTWKEMESWLFVARKGVGSQDNAQGGGSRYSGAKIVAT